MKINSIVLPLGFKRFTSLRIACIPETAKLVILTGPNGSGKSSLFDALHQWSRQFTDFRFGSNDRYFGKFSGNEPIGSEKSTPIILSFHGEGMPDESRRRKAVYVRTAYRNDPQFQLNRLQRRGSPLDESRFSRIIENDASVSLNYERLVAQGVTDLYKGGSTTFDDYVEDSVGSIRDAMQRMFPALCLQGVGDPFQEGTFTFDKGNSPDFLYMNLSAGEKAAFDLILDLCVKKREYDDTVFCIDEPEAHMNTRLQGALLEELVGLLSETSQLWIATHSIGMMRKARDMYMEDPDLVAFVDFHDKDFDIEQVLTPTVPNRTFWMNVLDTALADLTSLVAPDRVVICEGAPNATKVSNAEHDSRCYDTIFAGEVPEVKFLAGGNSKDVESDRLTLVQAIGALVGGTDVIRLIDRDGRTPQDIIDAKKRGVRVLGRRNLECYLFDDEVLTELWAQLGPAHKANALLCTKSSVMATVTPKDDVKKAAGQIFNVANKELALTQPGKDWRSFARDILAPLLQPGMVVYEELKEDVFGN